MLGVPLVLLYFARHSPRDSGAAGRRDACRGRPRAQGDRERPRRGRARQGHRPRGPRARLDGGHDRVLGRGDGVPRPVRGRRQEALRRGGPRAHEHAARGPGRRGERRVRSRACGARPSRARSACGGRGAPVVAFLGRGAHAPRGGRPGRLRSSTRRGPRSSPSTAITHAASSSSGRRGGPSAPTTCSLWWSVCSTSPWPTTSSRRTKRGASAPPRPRPKRSRRSARSLACASAGCSSRARDGARTRENAKNDGVRVLAAARQALLALGASMAERGLFDSADDILFLTWDEVPAARAGTLDTPTARGPASCRVRRQLRDHATTGGDRGVGRSAAHARPDDAVRARHAHRPRRGRRRGARTGARDPLAGSLAERVLPGEVLVAPFTDPGWTPYFIPAAAIVVDMGGMLSHGSIIAREYGIPGRGERGACDHADQHRRHRRSGRLARCRDGARAGGEARRVVRRRGRERLLQAAGGPANARGRVLATVRPPRKPFIRAKRPLRLIELPFVSNLDISRIAPCAPIPGAVR